MNDKNVLRELIKKTLEVANKDIQDKRRKMWTEFNSMTSHHVPVYILDPQGVWREIFDQKDLLCQDPLFRQYENWLRLQLYHDTFGDDFITEPWVTVYPEYLNTTPNWVTWGVPVHINRLKETMAMGFCEPPIKDMNDIEKLIPPIPIIDEARTEEKLAKLDDAFGGLIPIYQDRLPLHPHTYGLSYTLAYLLGPEGIMYKIYDEPEVVHALCRLLTDTYIQICDMAEEKGWYTNINHTFMANAQIQAMTYSDIPSPGQPVQVTSMKQHWIYDCAQEFEGIGPEMFNEFLIEYTKPVYEKFGLTAYGCCEGLGKKIKYLKRINNLRRVAVTPWTDIELCAKQLEDKYIISYRPHPADMVGPGWEPKRVKESIRKAKEIFDNYNCYWEINLKDFLTVQHDKTRLEKWVEVVREAIE